MLSRILRHCSLQSGFRIARFSSRTDTAAISDLSGKIATSFVKNPELTGKQILESLGPEERSRLIKILHWHHGASIPEPAAQAASR